MHAYASRFLYAETLWSGPLRDLLPSAEGSSDLNRVERRRHVHGSEHVGEILMNRERDAGRETNLICARMVEWCRWSLPSRSPSFPLPCDLFGLASGERYERRWLTGTIELSSDESRARNTEEESEWAIHPDGNRVFGPAKRSISMTIHGDLAVRLHDNDKCLFPGENAISFAPWHTKSVSFCLLLLFGEVKVTHSILRERIWNARWFA